MSLLPKPPATFNIASLPIRRSDLRRINIIADGRKLPPLRDFGQRRLAAPDLHFALALTAREMGKSPGGRAFSFRNRIFELENTTAAPEKWLFHAHSLDSDAPKLLACAHIGNLGFWKPEQIEQLLRDIPTPVTETKDGNVAWTKLAVSVLQKHKIVRPMNLDDLINFVREIAARRYNGTQSLRNTAIMLSKAEVMEVQAISDSVARQDRIDKILKSPRIF